MQRWRCLNDLSRVQRMLLGGVLALLSSFLLGLNYLPSAQFFWTTALGRIAFALLLVFLPHFRWGKFRPYLVVFLVSGILLHNTPWQAVFIVLSYLCCDLYIDSWVLEQSTEQDALLEFGLLSGFRLGGLWLALFLKFGPSQHLPSSSDLLWWTLLLLLSFWAFSLEAREDQLWSLDRKPSKLPPQVKVEYAFHYLSKPWALLALVNLFAISLAAGLKVGPLLPYPLIHPALSGNWFEETLPKLLLCFSGVVMVWFLEKFRLATQLVISATFNALCAIAALGLAKVHPNLSGAIAFCAILISGRAVLREVFRVEQILKAITLTSIWAFGGLLGAALANSKLSNWLYLGLIAVNLAYVATSFRRFSEAGKEVEKEGAVSDRFGDRKQDFTAIEPQRRSSRKLNAKLARIIDFFLVTVPVWGLMLAVCFGTAYLGWQVVAQKDNWEKQMATSAKVFRTELFLNAFSRRLHQEMLATNEVPPDWGEFIGSSFSSQGEKLDDRDLWGNPYRFTELPDSVMIECAGPDKLFDTPDDMSRQISKPKG